MRKCYPFWQWEDYAAGFYLRVNPLEFPKLIKRALFAMRQVDKWGEWMESAVQKWPIAAQHNLIGYSKNRRSWTGQAAICLWQSVPAMVTKSAWWELTVAHQERANFLADQVITEFVQHMGEQRRLW